MKRAVILLNGTPPQKELAVRYTRDTAVYCCDGAAKWAQEYGIEIAYLIGDMDSLDSRILDHYIACGVHIRKLQEEKDETDAQIALQMAMEDGAMQITLLGATGKRLDHMMGNLMLLKKAYDAGCEAYIVDEYSRVYVQNGAFEIQGRAGQLVSVLPMGENVRCVATKGLYYPCSDKLLRNDEPLFLSNYMTQERAYIHLDGYAWVVLSEELK
ncbi:MAG: thiamine diphosphokinase [Christensenellales bacterium]|jgi:thiamine pyrophosphokinase